MTYTFDADVISDLHKDAYGLRPGQSFWAEWTQSTDDGKQAIWDSLLVSLHAEMNRERQAQRQAIQQFERLVTKTVAQGACDRETALRWIMDAADCQGDWEFLCFHHGLPYGYFATAA